MMPRTEFCAHLMTVAARGDHISDTDFAECCYQAVSAHGFDPAHLRTAMEIGVPAYERWMAGANLPHPMVRAKVLLAIAHYLKTA